MSIDKYETHVFIRTKISKAELAIISLRRRLDLLPRNQWRLRDEINTRKILTGCLLFNVLILYASQSMRIKAMFAWWDSSLYYYYGLFLNKISTNILLVYPPFFYRYLRRSRYLEIWVFIYRYKVITLAKSPFTQEYSSVYTLFLGGRKQQYSDRLIL